MKIDPIYQKTTSDCGKACVNMVLNYYDIGLKGLEGLANVVDGVQVRTIESFLRERGLSVLAGNMNYGMLVHFIERKVPVICLMEDHYVLVKSYIKDRFTLLYNCPIHGEKKTTCTKFKKMWSNDVNDLILKHWAIAAYK